MEDIGNIINEFQNYKSNNTHHLNNISRISKYEFIDISNNKNIKLETTEFEGGVSSSVHMATIVETGVRIVCKIIKKNDANLYYNGSFCEYMLHSLLYILLEKRYIPKPYYYYKGETHAYIFSEYIYNNEQPTIKDVVDIFIYISTKVVSYQHNDLNMNNVLKTGFGSTYLIDFYKSRIKFEYDGDIVDIYNTFGLNRVFNTDRPYFGDIYVYLLGCLF